MNTNQIIEQIKKIPGVRTAFPVDDRIVVDLEEEVESEIKVCYKCKQPARYWPDLNRRTCSCGGLGYNVL